MLRRIFNDVGKLYDKMLQCFVGRHPAPGASRFALGIKNTYGCMIPGMTVYISSKTLLVTRYFLCPFLKG
jgi:hypothetical protein